MKRTRPLLLAAPLLFAACHAPGDELRPIQIDTSEHALTYSDSRSSYTINGGSSYNLFSYSSYCNTYSTQQSGYYDGSGTKSGISANGPSTDGVLDDALSGLELERSLLDNLGSPFPAKLVDGRTYQMVVVAAYEDEETSRRYFEVETSLDGQPWIPLCGLDAAGAPIVALAVPGVFTAVALHARDRAGGWRTSADEFNFACRGSSVAKCVELGYAQHLEKEDEKNEKKASEDELPKAKAQAYHQACVRMMRADYCGDGESHTEAGVLLRHWDRRGKAPDIEGWDFEAGWDEHGATCIDDLRQASGDLPSCVVERLAGGCSGSGLSKSLIHNAH